MKFQVVNGIDPGNDREVALIADVAGQFANLVCSTSEPPLAPVPVIFKPGAAIPEPGFTPVFLLDKPDVDGAEGYHDIDSGGQPYAKCFLSTIPGGEWLHDPTGQGQALAPVAMHEIAEALGDRLANFWVSLMIRDPSSRRMYNQIAAELCDPVQNFSFPMKATDGTTVDAADFVLPNFFNPDAKHNFSYMDVPTEPGQVCQGGYAIVQNSSSEGQVFARLGRAFRKHKPTRIFHAAVKPPEWREAMFEAKKHSRSKKRLAG